MAYDREQLRNAVRNVLQNATDQVLADDKLDVNLEQGKRSLDQDNPRLISESLAGAGSKWIDLNTKLTHWDSGFSRIDHILYPAPKTNDETGITQLAPSDYRQIDIGGTDWLFVSGSVATGHNILIYYTAPWKIIGIDDAVETTLTQRMINALEFVCVAYTCMSMAARAAGLSDNNVPTDFMNFRSKEQEYRRVAQDYMTKYHNELGLNSSKEPGFMMRGSYNLRNRPYRERITHWE